MGGSRWMKVSPLFFLLIFWTVGSSRQQASTAGVRQIPMRAGAPFKMAVFADLHFGEAASTEWGPLQDLNSTTVINTVLHDEAPDGGSNSSLKSSEVKSQQWKITVVHSGRR
ncbi:hypothetical protein Fmac_025120 [Flemingia macrophylla]|uniref:Uncharacterized protein n=1 Tax=Flemingia macrophylla TaxID=520843 RepID=A0ABD1LRC7_9FABA